jgi:hypothetical protein
VCEVHYNWNDFQVLQPGFEASEYLFQQEPEQQPNQPLLNDETIAQPNVVHSEDHSSSHTPDVSSVTSPDRGGYYFASPSSGGRSSGVSVRNKIESTPSSPWISDSERIHHPSGELLFLSMLQLYVVMFMC